MSTIVTLACTECKERNYSTQKSGMKRKSGGGGQRPRLGLKKYCRRCRKHTTHNETR